MDGLFGCVFRVVPQQASSPCGAQRSVTSLKLQLGTQTVQCLAYVKGEPVATWKMLAYDQKK